MRKIAHIINPVKVPIGSDLSKAQPITFDALFQAKTFTSRMLEVELFSAQYPEDREIIPDFILMTPDLNRSVLDMQYFENKRKLPLIKDILDRLYSASDAEYFIYSNVDISPLPMFYMTINKIIDDGIDSFVINRRTISEKHNRKNQVMMYAELGKSHPGHDCFIFQRNSYLNFELGSVCIGAPFVGRALLWNMIIHSKAFKEFKDFHLTFHLGNEKVWKLSQYDEYKKYNMHQALSIQHSIEQKYGPFNRYHKIFPFLIHTSRNSSYFWKLLGYRNKLLKKLNLTKNREQE
jgi:hypothetical protein